MGAGGNFLLFSLPLSAEMLKVQGAELWTGRSGSTALAVGVRCIPSGCAQTCLLFCFCHSPEASLSRHASQVGLRIVCLLPLISLGLGPRWRPGYVDSVD